MEKGVILDQDLTGITHSDLDRLKQGGVDVQFFRFGVMEHKQTLSNML